MTSLPARVSGIVFDCDGLLLDTEVCWTRAETTVFAKYGRSFGPEEKDLLIGKDPAAASAVMAEFLGLPGRGPELQAELFALVEKELGQKVLARPGAESLVAAVAGRIPVAVATNSPRRLFELAIRSSGLDRYFAVTATADEVVRPKPAPDLYLAAFERLGADPRAGVALEDSTTGAAAARASGAFLIAVPSQPGKQLDGDYNAVSLADPEIQAWAETVAFAG